MLKKLEGSKLVALKAAEALRKHGHCKGIFYSDGKMCLVGALAFAISGEETPNWYNCYAGTVREEEIKEVLSELRPDSTNPWTEGVMWNYRENS